MSQSKSSPSEIATILKELRNYLLKEDDINSKKKTALEIIKKIGTHMDINEFLKNEQLISAIDKEYPRIIFIIKEILQIQENNGDAEDTMNVVKYYQFSEKCQISSFSLIQEYFDLLVSFISFEDCENENLINEAKQDFEEYFERSKKNVDINNTNRENQFSSTLNNLVCYLLDLDNETNDFICKQVEYLLKHVDNMINFVHKKESAPELLDTDEVRDQLKKTFPYDFAVLTIMLEISNIKDGYKSAVDKTKKISQTYYEKITRWLKEEFDKNRSKRFMNFLADKQQKCDTFSKRELKILFKYNFKYFLGHPTTEELITISMYISSCVAGLTFLKKDTIFFSKTINFLLVNFKANLITFKDLIEIYRFLANRYIGFDTMDEKAADSSLKEILDFCMNTIFQS